MYKNFRRAQGFTLIEVSLVLIIIGLIVGGVVLGQQLIRVAQLRGDIKAVVSMGTAVRTFQTKYNCLPGDCAQASNFFENALDGDGDERLVNQSGGYEVYTLNHMANESAFLMQHLQAAGLIATGVFDPLTTEAFEVGKGLYPLKSMATSGISLQCLQDDVANSDLNCFYFMLGVSKDDSSDMLSTLSPPYNGEEALSVDGKIDDGKPATGLVVGLSPRVGADQISLMSDPIASETEILCALDASNAFSENTYYNTQNAKKLCTLRMKAAF